MTKVRKYDSDATLPGTRPVGGPQTAGVFYDEVKESLAVVPDGSTSDIRYLPEVLTATAHLAGSAPATAANYGEFWIAPFACQVTAVTARWGTASSSGTVNVNKTASGTAADSGTAILSSAISTAGNAATNAEGTLSATESDLQLAAGDALTLEDGGTLTSGANLVVTVSLKRI